VAVLGLGVCLAASAAERRLNLYIWSEYIDPAVVSQFERQFQCKVSIDLYEESESMLAKLQNGGDSLYDVVVPSDHLIPAMRKLGLLAELRHTNLTNLVNLDPAFLNPAYDPGNRHSVPYQWGTVGILARQPKDKPLLRSWSLLFDPAQQPGPFVVMDSMRDTLSAALKFKGHSLNSTNSNHLREARDLLVQTKKRCLAFEGSVAAKNRILARSVAAAMVYSGEGIRAMREDPGTVYFVPEEGGQVWVDNLVVTARAPHRDLAEQFINFVLEPEVSARISNFTRFSTPNRAARKHIAPEDLANPAMYPPPEIRSKLEVLSDLGPGLRLYNEVWTQVKAR
jgi:spermidine/putrescine transport system substrate-binding protein